MPCRPRVVSGEACVTSPMVRISVGGPSVAGGSPTSTLPRR